MRTCLFFKKKDKKKFDAIHTHTQNKKIGLFFYFFILSRSNDVYQFDRIVTETKSGKQYWQ